uniref:Cactin_mid domain-containing protein n=1 Tax=Caenorhabditis japonica TaxID=281687 RepID=A0A8R1DRH6_CAEJA
ILIQIKERTRIRIDQGRAKAIDLLTRYARFIDDVEKIPDFELENPIDYIKNACKSSDDLEDLLEDIKTFRQIDGWLKNETWWLDISKIAEDEITKRERQGGRAELNLSLQSEVQNMFKEPKETL